MSDPVTIAAAGNVFPAALACLRGLGYVVTVAKAGRLCRAERDNVTLAAEDPLLLLGLAKLHELRGAEWKPTDAEIEEALSFDSSCGRVPYIERVDAWEEQGAIHVLCVSSYGDPVELSEEEAQVFSGKLASAISKASGHNG